MIKCPNADCGYENVDGTQFCEGCGEELPQAGAGATSANAASGNAGGNTPIHGAATTTTAAPDQIRCPACENMNPADNVVCEVCGTELHPGAAAGAAASGAAASTTAPLSSVPTQSSTGSSVTPGAAPSMAGPSTSTDPLASGTAAPPTAAIAASTTASTDPSATTFSADAPAAMATTIAPSVGGSSDAGMMMPVVAAGDTTSGISPTGTTMPMADDAFTAPSATSSPVAGGIASADPVSASPTATAPTVADPGAPTIATQSANMEPGRVKMTVEQGMTIGKQFVLGDAEVLVGREDEEEQIFPDIDLSDQDEGYVHRKHAQLKFENGGLTVTHLGGANKTRVNNKPLADNVPQAVNIGDKVSFGKVVMRVGSI